MRKIFCAHLMFDIKAARNVEAKSKLISIEFCKLFFIVTVIEAGTKGVLKCS